VIEGNPVQEQNNSEPTQSGLMSFALRLFWMLLGYMIVFTSLGVIIVNAPGFPSMLDGIVWLTVAVMIVVRYVDITRWRGTTAIGETATLADWRSYAVIVVSITAAASAIAHILGR
jgi:hypothetical protein